MLYWNVPLSHQVYAGRQLTLLNSGLFSNLREAAGGAAVRSHDTPEKVDGNENGLLMVPCPSRKRDSGVSDDLVPTILI